MLDLLHEPMLGEFLGLKIYNWIIIIVLVVVIIVLLQIRKLQV